MNFSYRYNEDGAVEAVNLELVRDLTLTIYRDEWNTFAKEFRSKGMDRYYFGDVSLYMGTDEWFDVQEDFDAIDEAIRNNIQPEDV